MRSANNQLAAARTIRVGPEESVVYIVENYSGSSNIQTGQNYNILYGVPLNVPDLPDNLSDIEAAEARLPNNPEDERFFTPNGEELPKTPDIDDDSYTPEVTLRPKFPEFTDFSPHNITVGVSLFRNKDLQQLTATPPNSNAMRTYQGYSLRYAYTFRSYFWLRKKTPALLSAELGIGTYRFNHTFSSSQMAEINVMPLIFNFRYLIEVNKLFRIYPYLGYQNNIVSANSSTNTSIGNLGGGRLLGGGGAMAIMSKTMDVRLDAGTDGILFGLVTKF